MGDQTQMHLSSHHQDCFMRSYVILIVWTLLFIGGWDFWKIVEEVSIFYCKNGGVAHIGGSVYGKGGKHYFSLVMYEFCSSIVCIVVSTLKPLLKSASCSSPPFRLPPISFLCKLSPLKFRFFSENPKYKSFSSVTLSYLLKVTKFVVKISQFEFLIVTEKYFCL